MSRYAINFDKTVNQLVPYYIGGRKLILYLQALLKPLQTLNDDFVEWAAEKKIEANMTSQTFKLEWYLNRKYRKYFSDPSASISISNSNHLGVPMYSVLDVVDQSEQFVLTEISENSATEHLFYFYEEGALFGCSFMAYSPKVNTALISQEEYDALLRNTINRYKLSGKTYKIKYPS